MCLLIGTFSPLLLYVTLSNFKCICPSGSLRMCAEERFFVTYTPTHRTGSRCGPNLCLLFLFCQLYLSFSCFLSPLFLTAIIFSLPFCFSFSFLGSKKGKNMEKENDKDTETEKKRVRKVQGEIVGLALYQWWHSTKSWAQVSVCLRQIQYDVAQNEFRLLRLLLFRFRENNLNVCLIKDI